MLSNDLAPSGARSFAGFEGTDFGLDGRSSGAHSISDRPGREDAHSHGEEIDKVSGAPTSLVAARFHWQRADQNPVRHSSHFTKQLGLDHLQEQRRLFLCHGQQTQSRLIRSSGTLFPTSNRAYAGAKKLSELRLTQSEVNPHTPNLIRLHGNGLKSEARHAQLRFSAGAILLRFLKPRDHVTEQIRVHFASLTAAPSARISAARILVC